MMPISDDSKTCMSRSYLHLSNLNQQASDNYGFSLNSFYKFENKPEDHQVNDRKKVHPLKKVYKSDLESSEDLSPEPDTGKAKARRPKQKMYPKEDKYSKVVKSEPLKFAEYRVTIDDMDRSKEILNFLKKKHFNTPRHLEKDTIRISKKDCKLGTDIRLDLLQITPKIKNGYI